MFYIDKKERKLTENDREGHLSIKDRVEKPFAAGMVIRMNSTYLELVDGGYAVRGIGGLFGLLPVFAAAFNIFTMLLPSLLKICLNINDIENHFDEIWFALSMTVICSLLLGGVVKLNRSTGEWFGYTHYPILLNRKSRMVYVFDGDDPVLTVPWDELYFVLRSGSSGVGRYLIGAKILKGPDTVATSFSFGYTVVGKEQPLQHWEFIRRYMEEGPQAVMHADGFQICLPIVGKRETLHQGWLQLFAFFGGGWLSCLMLPFTVGFFVGRLINRATSKIQYWPAEVEAACPIDPNDPYVRDERQNPAWYR